MSVRASKNKKMKKTRLLLITFFGVLFSVFAAGFVAMNFGLKHLEKTYIELQLEASKRQAENMAKFISSEIENGVSQDFILEQLQNSIMGTDVEKGFLCMFDKTDAHLVCHPKLNMVGMKLPNTFKFKEINTENEQLTTNYIEQTTGGGGIFKTEDGADIAYLQPIEGTNWVLALHQNKTLIQQAVSTERKMYLIGSILAGIIIAIFATLVSRFISSRYERKIENQNIQLRELNSEIFQQKEEINTQKEQIEEQYTVVNKQKTQITSSITYASRIQHAMLPIKNKINDFFTQNFILYKPRDIVSGDFYWFMNEGSHAVYVAADSTGHGVPGAFMSMLGIAFLNEIVSQKFHQIKSGELTSNLILEYMKQKVITSLKQDDTENKDGMDLALCIIDKNKNEINYSGANNQLVYISNNELIEIKADKMPIGTYYSENKTFTNHKISVKENSSFFMFSDGYVDQFGGEKHSKFMKKRFYNILLSNSNKNMQELKNILEKSFSEWKNNIDQVDDVLVVGFKI